eukprot:Platyproteum_vivax@DN3514_c0_g1_i2.p1
MRVYISSCATFRSPSNLRSFRAFSLMSSSADACSSSTNAFVATPAYLPCLAVLLFLFYTPASVIFGTQTAVPVIVMLVLLYAPAVMSFAFFWAAVFKRHQQAYIKTLFFIMFLPGVFVLLIHAAVFLFRHSKNPTPADIRQGLQHLPRFLWPPSALSIAFKTIADRDIPVDHWEASGASATALGIQAVVYLVFAICFDYMEYRLGEHLSHARTKNLPVPSLHLEDEDVKAERQTVLQEIPAQETIHAKHLRKAYTRHAHAVRDVTFSLNYGIFGLLGINGAGKTTVMSMLAGILPIDPPGEVHTLGYNIRSHRLRAQAQLGFCHQTDALLPMLSVKEHLLLFGRLRGIPPVALDAAVEHTMRGLGLKSVAELTPGTLSGGGRRRLSVAVAIIGEPRVVYLDEPSTGMDPVAKRKMWKMIQRMSERNTVVVLTTHSMEEAEALCNRITIMVDGQFCCLGSRQHLMDKYGQGFVLSVHLTEPSEDEILSYTRMLFRATIRPESYLTPLQITDALSLPDMLKPAEEKTEAWENAESKPLNPEEQILASVFVSWYIKDDRCHTINNLLQTLFPVCELARSNGFNYHFKIQQEPGDGFAEIFRTLEQHKEIIGRYSLAQTSLEDIFNYFANQAAPLPRPHPRSPNLFDRFMNTYHRFAVR